MKKTKAFTLVELLIIVVIIGILAATILPKLTGSLSRTRDLKGQEIGKDKRSERTRDLKGQEIGKDKRSEKTSRPKKYRLCHGTL